MSKKKNKRKKQIKNINMEAESPIIKQLNEPFPNENIDKLPSKPLSDKERETINKLKERTLKDSKLKKTILSLLPLIFLSTLTAFIILFGTPKINNVEISEKINGDNTKTITMYIHNPFQMPVTCAIENKEETSKDTKWIKSYDNKCTFNVNSGSYYLFIKDKHNKITKFKTDNVKINKILDLTLNTDLIYLTLGETYTIKSEITSIGEVDETITYESTNPEIATVENGVVTPTGNGKTEIAVKTSSNIEKKVNVIVTDLYKKASQENNKTKLPCKIYNNTQAEMIDKILEYKINQAGYKTRGAVVAAARFIVLEFPYKVPYFFENGRLNNYDGKNYVDGEGRYYKKGMYLSEEKFSTIKATFAGPAIWGCPLMNYQDEYGFVPYQRYPNGLDCSGFVTWTLYNAGFDVGDSGAGGTYRDDDIGDLGIKHELTKDFIYNGSYKVGDLIGRDGHIAIIAGIDDENIYIAESLVGGVVIKEFAKNGYQLYNLYGFINTMDEVYEKEGVYTNIW